MLIGAGRLIRKCGRSGVELVPSDQALHMQALSRTFRRFYGEPIGDYLRRIRVQFACQKLADPEVDLAQVGIEAGFADQSHFTRIFKRVTGLTPGDFRKVVPEPVER